MRQTSNLSTPSSSFQMSYATSVEANPRPLLQRYQVYNLYTEVILYGLTP